MLLAYKTNAPMRQAYLRINRIIHAEVWDDENGYVLVLCSSDGVGFPESPVFGTTGQCVSWLRNTCACNDLPIKM